MGGVQWVGLEKLLSKCSLVFQVIAPHYFCLGVAGGGFRWLEVYGWRQYGVRGVDATSGR